MHSHSINFLLDLTELNISWVHQETETFFVDIQLVAHMQPCQFCESQHVIIYARNVHHLLAFSRRFLLRSPMTLSYKIELEKYLIYLCLVA